MKWHYYFNSQVQDSMPAGSAGRDRSGECFHSRNARGKSQEGVGSLRAEQGRAAVLVPSQ